MFLLFLTKFGIMPQQMNVLRCYSCKMYQVHLIKQAKKWQCKVCNHKQILRQVFFRGSGKDCRICVKKLNMMKEHGNETNEFFYGDNNINDNNSAGCSNQSNSGGIENKWAKYLETPEDTECNTSKFVNNESNSNENNDESMYSHNDDTTYECSQNDYVNTSINYYYESQSEQDHCDDKHESTQIKKTETFDDTNSSDGDSQIYNKSVTDTKYARNIFDDNEDFDVAIDF
uniref:MRN complex-interacting protein n=1 Tax=Osmia lignaria TaxID=473952 RepID=UPI001478C6F3|nr:MRN complex-interacting protein [Osmia lignaria]